MLSRLPGGARVRGVALRAGGQRVGAAEQQAVVREPVEVGGLIEGGVWGCEGVWGLLAVWARQPVEGAPLGWRAPRGDACKLCDALARGAGELLGVDGFGTPGGGMDSRTK